MDQDRPLEANIENLILDNTTIDPTVIVGPIPSLVVIQQNSRPDAGYRIWLLLEGKSDASMSVPGCVSRGHRTFGHQGLR